MRSRFVVLICSFLFGLLLVSGGAVFAEEVYTPEKDSDIVRFSFESVYLYDKNHPGTVFLNLAPGEEAKIEFYLENVVAESESNYLLYAADVSRNDQGTPEFTVFNQNLQSAGMWLDPRFHEVSLLPGEGYFTEFIVNVPVSQVEGRYEAAVMAEFLPGSVGGNALASGRIARTIVINVSENPVVSTPILKDRFEYSLSEDYNSMMFARWAIFILSIFLVYILARMYVVRVKK